MSDWMESINRKWLTFFFCRYFFCFRERLLPMRLTNVAASQHTALVYPPGVHDPQLPALKSDIDKLTGVCAKIPIPF